MKFSSKSSAHQSYFQNQSNSLATKQMANIKVKDLTCIAGIDLFQDSESFIQDLSDDGTNLYGGFLFRTETVPPIGTIIKIKIL
jgi:hypothetical protein